MEHKIEYVENDLVRIAKRENNIRRKYLVVNPLQGKHVPVVPSKALKLFTDLADVFRNEYKNEKLLLVGFAETATAIGAQAAISVGAKYIQTTREVIPNVEYLFFSEEHSHATEQKLVKDDIDSIADEIDRIVFVEDEVTTGNTILNIINILDREYTGKFKYSVASLLNGMDKEYLEQYRKKGIPLHYLIKTDHSDYSDRAEKLAEKGHYYKCSDHTVTTDYMTLIFLDVWMHEGWLILRNMELHVRNYGQRFKRRPEVFRVKKYWLSEQKSLCFLCFTLADSWRKRGIL